MQNRFSCRIRRKTGKNASDSDQRSMPGAGRPAGRSGPPDGAPCPGSAGRTCCSLPEDGAAGPSGRGAGREMAGAGAGWRCPGAGAGSGRTASGRGVGAGGAFFGAGAGSCRTGAETYSAWAAGPGGRHPVKRKSRAVASGRTRIRDLRSHHAGAACRRSDLLRLFRMPRPAKHCQFTIRSQRSGKHPSINATGAHHEEAGAEPACRGGDHRPDRDDTDDGPHSRQVPQA